ARLGVCLRPSTTTRECRRGSAGLLLSVMGKRPETEDRTRGSALCGAEPASATAGALLLATRGSMIHALSAARWGSAEMESGNSGIFRLASVGSYLDALSSITDEMSLKERSNLIYLDKCLHAYWGLGQNVILNWCPSGDGIDLLAIPHYAVAAYSSPAPSGGRPDAPREAAQPPVISPK